MTSPAQSPPPTLTADAAMARICSGQHLFVGSGVAAPHHLLCALVARASALRDVELTHILTIGDAPHLAPALQKSFRHNACFIGSNARSSVAHGFADYTPTFLHEIPHLFRSRRLPIDVALIQVAPPNEHGRMSLGVSVDVVRAAIDVAPLVIAEINPRMPHTYGEADLGELDVDILVPHTSELPECPSASPDAAARAIGAHVARLIADGATLQMGIGAIPDAVLASLHEKKHLGIHTEMFSDGILPLIDAGVITNRKKTLYPDQTVTSFCMGTRTLYDRVDQNKTFAFLPSDFVNDPFVIAQNDHLVAINSALQIDLTGQVCADSIGTKFFSGVGGQVDFIRGAARSRGGKSVIALPSTAKDGTLSRIVPTLDPGAGVVTTRADVDFVVTEFGIACLKGRTIRERALALISLAHPNFRAALRAQAAAFGFFDLNVVPESASPEHAHHTPWERHATARDGREILLRVLKISDARYRQDLWYRLSAQERALCERARPAMAPQHSAHADAARELLLGAFELRDHTSQLIGLYHATIDATLATAQPFLIIDPDWRRAGVANHLARAAAPILRERGVRSVHVALDSIAPASPAMIISLLDSAHAHTVHTGTAIYGWL